MTSSISPSRHLFWVLLVSLAVSYIVGAAYTLLWNPEIRFWKEAYAVKMEHARLLDAAGQPKTVFVGGSSSAFQIDPQILDEKFGIPSVNMGMHAGIGARVIVALALPLLKPNDHLILNIEPDLLAGDLEPTPLGLQFLVATGNFPALSLLPSSAKATWDDALLALRPGLRNVVTMLGKVVAMRPIYRYSTEDIHLGGYLTTKQKGALAMKNTWPKTFTHTTDCFLSELASFTAKKNIVANYLLPWACFQRDTAASARRNFAQFAHHIDAFLPEIHDGQAGVDSQLEEFADTPLHMTQSGAQRRTNILGTTLNHILQTP